MKYKRILLLVILAALLFGLSGCFPGDGSKTPDNVAGFFWGIWHGWIAPISLIRMLFNDSIRIYEVNNNGFWYSFGFYMAIISGFGGLSIWRSRD
ncbi:MAG: hypothetical protein FWC32_01195 [Firmicutes bacterium]|nr:hypothetical protein [Bacillota bacterium]